MNKGYHKLNLQLPEKEMVEALQKLALSLGYIQTRGPAKGRGSISGMIEALARNQLIITKKESEHEKPDNQTPTRIRKETSSDY